MPSVPAHREPEGSACSRAGYPGRRRFTIRIPTANHAPPKLRMRSRGSGGQPCRYDIVDAEIAVTSSAPVCVPVCALELRNTKGRGFTNQRRTRSGSHWSQCHCPHLTVSPALEGGALELLAMGVAGPDDAGGRHSPRRLKTKEAKPRDQGGPRDSKTEAVLPRVENIRSTGGSRLHHWAPRSRRQPPEMCSPLFQHDDRSPAATPKRCRSCHAARTHWV